MSDKPIITYLSLGWGVQSWTIASMVALGDLPPIDYAIHADTGHEASGTYAHAEKWTPWLKERGVKVVTVQGKRTELVRTDWSGSVQIPAYTSKHQDGTHGQVKRQCTANWKITPIRVFLRELLDGKLRPGSVAGLQGISFDEWHRMRTSDVKYIVNEYPLVDRRITRAGCVAYLEQHGLDIPPKSACVFCPYHSRTQWKDLKAKGGVDWDKAVEVDANLRSKRPGFDLYIHPTRLPLSDAVRIPADYGAEQLELEIPCDGGVCFV